MGELAFVIKVRDDGSAVIERFSKNLGKSGVAAKKTGNVISRSFAGIRSGISGAVSGIFNLRNAIVGLAAVQAVRVLTRQFAAFESQMLRVAVLTGADPEALGGSFAKLNDLARTLGATTAFTAKQAAEGMEFLALAGFKTSEIMTALPATLQLAAAAQLQLGEAADIVTNVLTGLRLPIEDLESANDVLVKTFTSTNTTLQQLGEAFKFVGPVATSAGLQFEEVSAALGLLGNAGIQASMAGTTLRGTIARLLAPSAEAQKILKSLGVTVLDSSKKMRPLADILDDLAEGGAVTSDIFRIFGQRAGPGIASLLAQGSDALRELTRELENAGGVTERAAEVQLRGLNGALIRMKSAVEGATLSIGEELAPIITSAAETVRELAGEFTNALKAMNLAAKQTKSLREQTTSFIPTAETLIKVFGVFSRTISIIKLGFQAFAVGLAVLATGVLVLVGAFESAGIAARVVDDLADSARATAKEIRNQAIQEEFALRALKKRTNEAILQKGLDKDIAFGRREIFRLTDIGLKRTIEQDQKLNSLRKVQSELETDLRIGQTTTFALFEKRRDAIRKEEDAVARLARQEVLRGKAAREAAFLVAREREISVAAATQLLRIPFDPKLAADREAILKGTRKSLAQLDKEAKFFLLLNQDTSVSAIRTIVGVRNEASGEIFELLQGLSQQSQAAVLQDLAAFKGTEEMKLAIAKRRVKQQASFERQFALQSSASLFGALASLSETFGEKSFEVTKKFQLAEAITSGILAVQRALASGPPPFNFIAAAAVAAQTIANVRRIQQAQPGGGAGGISSPGGGAGGGAAGGGGAQGIEALEPAMEAGPAAPAQQVTISVAGFVGDEATLARELGRVFREATGDGVEFGLETS